MLRRFFDNISDWCEDRLRRIIRPLSPDARVIVILTMLVLFGGLSIYMTVSGIYNFGKDRGRRLEIERIESVKLRQEAGREIQPDIPQDSINNLNEFEYGRTDQ